MEIVNKNTYYMKVMSAFVVNAESSDDPLGNLKRVQIYIPSIQHLETTYGINYEEYMNLTGSKKGNENFNKFTWAFNTVKDVQNGDIVYVANVDNTVGSYVILGRDATCEKSGIGGGGELDPAGLAELLIPFIIHHECGVHSNIPGDHTKGKYNPTSKKHDNLYLCSGWDSEVPDTAYACYTTSTSSSASVGLFNWDASRGFNILVQVAQRESNWSSYWNTSHDLYIEIKKNAEGTADGVSKGTRLFRTSNEEDINSIQKMLTSNTGKDTQKSQARKDATEYIQWLMDKGITNPALLIFVGDTVNQYGKDLNKLYSAALDPSSIDPGDSNKLNQTINSYENPSSMMKDFERVAQWFLDVYEPTFQDKDTNRRKDCIAYVRELYKQGKFAQFQAGLTSLGDLVANVYKGVTLVSPLKDEFVEASQSDYYGGKLQHSFKAHPINTYFGHYKTIKLANGSPKPHPGVDFHINANEIYYAAHDGSLQISDSGGSGYGYHAKITFTDGGHNWTIIYGHMDRALSKPYFNTGTYDIKAGQPIGVGDSTGNSTGPHLHYEIRMDGSPVNPLVVLGMGNAHTNLEPGYLNE